MQYDDAWDAKFLADESVTYYEHLAKRLAREPWIAGFQAAAEWRRLINSHSASQQEVASLLTTAKCNQLNGSYWYLMAEWIYDWAVDTGHTVPPREQFFAPREEYFAEREKHFAKLTRPSRFSAAVAAVRTWLRNAGS